MKIESIQIYKPNGENNFFSVGSTYLYGAVVKEIETFDERYPVVDIHFEDGSLFNYVGLPYCIKLVPEEKENG